MRYSIDGRVSPLLPERAEGMPRVQVNQMHQSRGCELTRRLCPLHTPSSMHRQATPSKRGDGFLAFSARCMLKPGADRVPPVTQP